MNSKKNIRPAKKQTVSIPIPKFTVGSEIIVYRDGEEMTAEITARLYDVDLNVYRYRTFFGDLGLFYEDEIKLKTPCTSTEIQIVP